MKAIRHNYLNLVLRFCNLIAAFFETWFIKPRRKFKANNRSLIIISCCMICRVFLIVLLFFTVQGVLVPNLTTNLLQMKNVRSHFPRDLFKDSHLFSVEGFRFFFFLFWLLDFLLTLSLSACLNQAFLKICTDRFLTLAFIRFNSARDRFDRTPFH